MVSAVPTTAGSVVANEPAITHGHAQWLVGSFLGERHARIVDYVDRRRVEVI